MENIIKLIDVVIWPITIFLLLIIFKRELKVILKKLSNLKYRDFEATFDAEIKRVEEQAKIINDKSTDKSKFTGTAEVQFITAKDNLLEIARYSPKAAIISAWQNVEVVLKSYISTDSKVLPLSQTLEVLHIDKKIDNSYLEMIKVLNELRNESVHMSDFEPSYLSAEKYIEASYLLINKINKLKESA